MLSYKRSLYNEKSAYLNEKSPPLSITRENPVHSNKDPAQRKKKKKVPVKRVVRTGAHTHIHTHTCKHLEEADCGEMLGEDFWSFIIRIMTGKTKHCFEICLCV